MDCGVVLSYGTGNRFGTNIPKQYNTLNGRPVISYSIDALLKSTLLQKIVVTIDKRYRDLLPTDKRIECIDGGNTRNKSLKSALDYINRTIDCDRIIILEAARPMITTKIVDDYLNKLNEGWDAVITGQKITDSLGCYDSHTVDRNRYYLIQAPEAFKFKILYANFDATSELTATNQHLPENSKLYINFDFNNNYKITYQNDIEIIENLMRLKDDL